LATKRLQNIQTTGSSNTLQAGRLGAELNGGSSISSFTRRRSFVDSCSYTDEMQLSELIVLASADSPSMTEKIEADGGFEFR
jgi:hypothetical protein